MLRSFKELGGIKVYAVNLLENLLRLDQKNQYILCYNDPSLLGGYSKYSNVKEVVLKMPTRFLWDQVAVPWFAQKEKIDIIFNPKLSIPLLTKAKTVFPLHGLEQFAVSEVFPILDRFYFRLMMPLFCRKASAVICMTQMGVNEAKKYLKLDFKNIYPIHESQNSRFKVLEKKGLEMIRKEYHLPEKYLLFVGGINPLKNFSNILRAYHLLRDRIPHKLVIVGFKRWKFEGDLALVKQLGLEKDVVFTGFVPDKDLPAIYNLADVFVFPSLYEGFGIPILEAMASGCPVVTTKTGCSPEVAGGAAFLVNPKNPQEIAFAIEKVVEDLKFRSEMIQKGLVNAAKFSWESTASKTLRLMESLCNIPSKKYVFEASSLPEVEQLKQARS